MITTMRKLNKAQKQILNRYNYCQHENELPVDALKQVIELNNYDEVYTDVTRYLYDTYVQLNGTPLREPVKG
jgi:predicted RecB family nuclease